VCVRVKGERGGRDRGRRVGRRREEREVERGREDGETKVTSQRIRYRHCCSYHIITNPLPVQPSSACMRACASVCARALCENAYAYKRLHSSPLSRWDPIPFPNTHTPLQRTLRETSSDSRVKSAKTWGRARGREGGREGGRDGGREGGREGGEESRHG
jgi:hypothetical protein